jgi:hypothetical protein
MDKKPKTGGATRKAKQQKLEDKEQSERFMQAAQDLGACASEKEFTEKFKRLIKNRSKIGMGN